MNQLYVDSNIIVSLLTKDEPEQFKHISDMLESGKYQLMITAGIILETCWILKRVFEFSNPQVGHALLHLLQVENVEPEEESIILTLNIYARHENMDIADCFLSAKSKVNNIPVVTFERDFRKLGCEYYKPNQLK
ncbi:PIN domain-containing protein [Paenibacillus pabuli]|uniref:PIN domain-containing protein n=1 Tax=Paenibacillus pabuli TaxID=1472 RepID=UPI003457A87C